MSNRIEAGRQLKQLRSQQQRSLRSFAREIDTDPAFLSRVENGIVSATPQIIDSYVSILGSEDNSRDFLRDYILLLSDRAPVDISYPEIKFLVGVLQLYRRYYT